MAKILIIEDDKTIQNLLKIALKRENHNAVAVPCATDGIDHASKRPTDLIILDLGLPDMDGINVVKSVRKFNEKIPLKAISLNE